MEDICLRHLMLLPNCLSGKLYRLRVPLAVHQNICFLQLMLSFKFVSNFNICQCNRQKIMPHFICIWLKLNMISSFLNYLLELWLFLSIMMFNNISQSETALCIRIGIHIVCYSWLIHLSFLVLLFIPTIISGFFSQWIGTFYTCFSNQLRD